ncbi:hypothetical protein [Rickettsia endosymbiont of Orchestes rusci]|uniref:hypothetical protein n=1 Tax=Rickettsia endosymbiont of Orchestes rusci TaxID=3066250 RepID=UPI00313CB6CC
MLKQVQHDKEKPGFPLLARMTYGTFLEPPNNAPPLARNDIRGLFVSYTNLYAALPPRNTK